MVFGIYQCNCVYYISQVVSRRQDAMWHLLKHKLAFQQDYFSEWCFAIFTVSKWRLLLPMTFEQHFLARLFIGIWRDTGNRSATLAMESGCIRCGNSHLYNLTSILWYLFIQHPRYYYAFLRDQTFCSKLPLLYDYDTRQFNIQNLHFVILKR